MKTTQQDAALHGILATAIAQAQIVGEDVNDAAVAAAKAFKAGLAAGDGSAPTYDPITATLRQDS